MSEWIKRLTERYSEVNEKKKMDPVNPDELKGTHAQRKDKDIDNDGDVDKSDEYLHNRRKAVKTAMKNEEVELDEAAPKLKGDWLKKEREKNREHDAAMGRTATGRKKPQRAMTSTQRSLASMRKENEVQVEEATIQPATRKGYQDPMGVGLSPSAKVELGRTTDAPSDAFDANKVIAKTFKDMRASLKNKKMRKGDQDIGDKAPVKNDGK
jgi:hypothetical protein